MAEYDDLTRILTAAEMEACTQAAEVRAGGIRQIVHAVAAATGIPARDIYGRCRTKHVARARQIVMLAAVDRGMSLSEIGRALGRDHSTVSFGVAAEKARR